MSDDRGFSGREIFAKYNSVIDGFCLVYQRLPAFVKRMLIFCFGDTAGRIGVLFRYIHCRSIFNGLGRAGYIGRYCVLKNAGAISIGDNFSFHEFGYMDGAGGITIGDNVSIAHNCSLVSFEHSWADENVPIKYNPIKLAPICIEDDVWLGCGVRVLSGSIIRSRVVVAAGAVVRGELESGFLYAGVPARKIKPL
jgi:acetyltransferase-like isoleucine patch superfamily enzyme